MSFAIATGPKGLSLLSRAEAAAAEHAIGAWVRIAPDGWITIVTPAAEMGQGSMTGVPIALAEELDADWSQVRLEMAPADPEIYGNSCGGRKSMGIYGSLAVRAYFTQMRIAGAQVRKVLLDEAAEYLEVGVDELTTEPSEVVHRASNRRFGYGEIAAIAAIAKDPKRMPDVSSAQLKKEE